jgi:hypothetical protein
LVELTVDGRRRPVRRTTRTGAQVFSASLGEDAEIARRTPTVSYTYRVLIQQQGHLLHLDLSRPTKGLHVELAYGGCAIRHVNVVDPSGRCGTPETEPGPSGVVAADELMSIPFPETLRAFAAGRRTDNPL